MIIAQAPVRFSLLGGGTDVPIFWQNYRDSEFVSMTLDKRVTVCVVYDADGELRRPPGEESRISYPGGYELVGNISAIKHSHIRETLAEISRQAERDCLPADIAVFSDVPSGGSGLGASSSLIVALLATRGYSTKPAVLDMSTRIEIERLGQPIGWQDQIAAIWGGFKHYGIESGEVKYMDLHKYGDWLASYLMAFPVLGNAESEPRKTHSTLTDMQEHIESRLPYLHHTLDLIPHLVKGIKRMRISAVADVMREGWRLKKASHNTSSELVDHIYNDALAAGALAGKMSGSMSAGVGTMFFLVPHEQRGLVKHVLEERYDLVQMPVCYHPYGVVRYD